jgi:hypothetical protein
MLVRAAAGSRAASSRPPIWSPAEWPHSPYQPHMFGVSQARRAAAVSDAVCVPASLWCD